MEAKTSFQDLKGQHCSFPITEVQSQSSDWIIPITKKLGVLGERSLKSSIFMVPGKLRKIDEAAYSPLIVSIGPLHTSTTTRSSIWQTSVDKDHLPAKEDDKWQYMVCLLQQTREKKHDHLLAVEEHKWWYMLYLLERTRDANETLVQCCNSILEMEKSVCRRYAENIKFQPHQLAEIMLVDGCFILELFRRSSFRDFTEEDPIFYNSWMVPTLWHDLALLENQIPSFILQKLYDIVIRLIPESSHRPTQSITDLALSFFYPDAITEKCSQVADLLHLLDHLHNFYIPTSPNAEPEGESPSNHARDHHVTCECVIPMQCIGRTKKIHPKDEKSWGFTKCATKLLEAGIELEKGNEKEDLLNIRFSDGVITIPPLHTDETTNSVLRNLIAFEQCLGNTKQHITSYAILVKSLIDSLADVELLERKGIITNNLGEVEDVLSHFNNMLREVVPKGCYFGKLREDVNAYEKSWEHWPRLKTFVKVRCDKYLAVLKSDYFSTPWSFISFNAAFVLLILTVVQTYYAVRSGHLTK